jgi:hypothetical protein
MTKHTLRPILVLIALQTFACSSAPDRAPPLAGGPLQDHETYPPGEVQAYREILDAGSADGLTPGETSCERGASRKCVIDLGYHQGIHDCAEGTQVCDGAEWSPCFPNDDRGTR